MFLDVLVDVFLLVFLSKIISVATNHSSGVMEHKNKKSHTCEVGGQNLRTSNFHLFINLKYNYFLGLNVSKPKHHMIIIFDTLA